MENNKNETFIPFKGKEYIPSGIIYVMTTPESNLFMGELKESSDLDEDVSKIVSLEQAKVLKENGYCEPTECYYQFKDIPYSTAGLKFGKNGKKINHNQFDDFIYSAPTIKEYLTFINKKS